MLEPKKRGYMRMGDQSDKEHALPPPDAFKPFATMFKSWNVDSQVVECVSCRKMYPLSDLLAGELNEEDCPLCLMTASEYWADKPHRPLPPQSGTD